MSVTGPRCVSRAPRQRKPVSRDSYIEQRCRYSLSSFEMSVATSSSTIVLPSAAHASRAVVLDTLAGTHATRRVITRAIDCLTYAER